MNTHAVSCQWLQLLTNNSVGIHILFKIFLKRYEYTRSQLSMVATVDKEQRWYSYFIQNIRKEI